MKIGAKLLFTCVIVLLAAFAQGADFSVRLLGEPDINASTGTIASLFDGGKNYSDPSLLFLGAVPQKGCGVVVEFPDAVAVSKVVVYTAKPNENLMAPTRTEFCVWDEDRQQWGELKEVSDVTGRAKDSSYISVCIATEWAPSTEPIRAFKATMFGAGIWLTEVEVFDADGKLLKPSGIVQEVLAGAKKYPPMSYLGGVPGNAGAWGKDQQWVGNPNSLNRRDRVVISFDMGPLIQAGKVKSAILDFSLQPIGCLTGNRISVNMLMPCHRDLTLDDLVFGTETFIEDFIFCRLSKQNIRIDVTDNVNALLEEGEAALTLRFRNETIELVGNRNNAAEGVMLLCEDAKLEVVK